MGFSVAIATIILHTENILSMVLHVGVSVDVCGMQAVSRLILDYFSKEYAYR